VRDEMTIKRRPAFCVIIFFGVELAGAFMTIDFAYSAIPTSADRLAVREVRPENSRPPVEFSRPVSIVCNRDKIFILDAADQEVKVISKTGILERTLGRKGQAPGEFNGPNDLDVLADRLFVADGGNRRVQILDAQGNYLGGFSLKFRPWRILALGGQRLIVGNLPSGLLEKEKVVYCYTETGFLLWDSLPAVLSSDPVHDAFRNLVFLKRAPAGGFWIVHGFDDRRVCELGPDGHSVRELPVPDAGYPFKDIAVPSGRGQKRTLRGFCWNCAADGERLYLLTPDYTPDGDLGPGKSIAVLDVEGRIIAQIDLPDPLSRIAVDGDMIYGIDLELRLRLFRVMR
jgi:hypothetical protein